MGDDVNAISPMWGSDVEVKRGERLVDMFHECNITTVNRGTTSTLAEMMLNQ